MRRSTAAQDRAGIHQDGRASGYVNPTLIPTSADPHPSPVGVDQRVHPSNSPLQTRKNYVSTLFAKLGMKQRTQAAAYAARYLRRLQTRIQAEQEDHRPEASVDQWSVSHPYRSIRFARSGSTAWPIRTPLPGIVLPVL